MGWFLSAVRYAGNRGRWKTTETHVETALRLPTERQLVGVELFRAAIAADLETGHHEGAVKLMDKVKEVGLQPDVVVYN